MSLYSVPSACVYNSGMLSKQFTILNATRQGCPLSPIILALIIEPLAISIRENADFEGIQLNSPSHKISLLSDDVIMMISKPMTSLPHVVDALHNFSLISYYKVNETKSLI